MSTSSDPSPLDSAAASAKEHNRIREQPQDVDADGGHQAFQKMLGIVENSGSGAARAEPVLCPVLAEPSARPSVVLCAICGRRQSGVAAAVRHQAVHAQAGRDDEEGRTCVLCGTLFPSALAMEMHRLNFKTEEGRTECQSCLEVFTDAEEADAHWCRHPREQTDDDTYECPLGCEGGRADGEALLGHLRAAHGCDERDVRFEGGAVLVRDVEEFNATCSLCGLVINTLNLPLETHLVFLCSARGPVVVENVKSIKQIAKKSGIDAHKLAHLELRAFLEETPYHSTAVSLEEKIWLWEEEFARRDNVVTVNVAVMKEMLSELRANWQLEDEVTWTDPSTNKDLKDHSWRPPLRVLKKLEKKLEYEVDADDFSDAKKLFDITRSSMYD